MTALREIEYLRGNKSFVIDTDNSNPFKILVNEIDGTTAYCFSMPIYNEKSKRLVNRKFYSKVNAAVFVGSNSVITVHRNHFVLKNQEGSISFDMPISNLKLKNGQYAPVMMYKKHRKGMVVLLLGMDLVKDQIPEFTEFLIRRWQQECK